VLLLKGAAVPIDYQYGYGQVVALTVSFSNGMTPGSMRCIEELGILFEGLMEHQRQGSKSVTVTARKPGTDLQQTAFQTPRVRYQ